MHSQNNIQAALNAFLDPNTHCQPCQPASSQESQATAPTVATTVDLEDASAGREPFDFYHHVTAKLADPKFI